MFNRQRKPMTLSRFPALCFVAMLEIGICTGAAQTNVPVPQNGPRAVKVNSVRGSNVRPNISHRPSVHRGLANMGQRRTGIRPTQIQPQPSTNLRPNYSAFTRQSNPTLAAMRVQPPVRTDNLQPTSNLLPGTEIAQATLPVTDAQRAVRADDPQPIGEALAKRELSEGFETIDPSRTPRKDKVEPNVGDSVDREPRRHKAKRRHHNARNRFSYSDALRHKWQWHDRDWWQQHCKTIVFVNTGYYFLNGSYWYPAWGYDPLYSYYDYDGPIYTYGNLLPDQVIANVQAALQEAGYYFGAITGSLSVETRAALVNFQTDYGLIVTGAIDEPTVEALGLY
jgi:Putative peptidoglycan binding domain